MSSRALENAIDAPTGAESFVYNGRFTGQKATGVQRVARELIVAMAQLPEISNITVAVPPGDNILPVDGAKTVKIGFGKGLFWEQFVLPLFAGRRRIVNLSNSGSIFRPHQVIFMHDAAVFDTPAHFSRRFRAWYRIMFWILARTSSCIVTNSDFSRQRLAHHCGVPASRIGVVPLGADHLDATDPDESVLGEHLLTSNRFVLAVSNLNPTKNFARIVEAFRQVNDPSLDLVIVGMKNPIFGKIEDISNIAPNIKYVGYVSDSKLKALYQHARCFVYPSIYEGFGIPPLEAMKNGCATLVASAAALPEVCGDAALYCDPYSSDDIAVKLKSLLYSDELRADLRHRGHLHAGKYRWQTSAQILLTELQKI
ncbi:glycosyltransferase family 4 protein [Paraburkholderia dioscoreae]|uniref:Glycosyl transferase family 4 n=1 Tax=Paraburkholderia dioscoreae TaxID=2604047 RepID=A0A5Q4YUL1_9BURK|nr:glycosyltransferase family 1 protein [Paraburkholderia dioscoreae]VVD27260.1 Glycosyl transferase family 4 [Paraburkholderia dioscoreae]